MINSLEILEFFFVCMALGGLFGFIVWIFEAIKWKRR